MYTNFTGVVNLGLAAHVNASLVVDGRELAVHSTEFLLLSGRGLGAQIAAFSVVDFTVFVNILVKLVLTLFAVLPT